MEKILITEGAQPAETDSGAPGKHVPYSSAGVGAGGQPIS